MNVIPTKIPDVLIIKPKVFGDDRGLFFESFDQKAFNEATGLDLTFVQDNLSKSAKNLLRGLPYQVQYPQGKQFRFVHGEVCDVAVDISKGSVAFGRWSGEILSAENKRELCIPSGLAHCFLVLSDSAEFLYKTACYFAPTNERSLIWIDPFFGTERPLSGATLFSEIEVVAKIFSLSDL